MARWREFDQPLHHGGADSSLSLLLECNWKLAVEITCEAYHLPSPSVAEHLSRLEDHYNILDNAGLPVEDDVYQPQINADGRLLSPLFRTLRKLDKGAEYVPVSERSARCA